MSATVEKLNHEPSAEGVPFRTSPSLWSLITLGLLCIAAFLFMGYVSLTEWQTGLWHLSDVGSIQYIMVNTLGGNFMYSASELGNFMAFHFTPFLFLLMPIIFLSDYPIPLISSYHLALALTPVPIFYLARNYKLRPIVGLALGVWFLGNHFVGSLQLSNHFESFYVLFALAVMALFPSRNAIAFWICAVLALSVKEDCSAWMLAFAIWQWVFNRHDPLVRGRALKFAVVCILWGALAGGAIYLASVQEARSAARYVDRMGGISIGADTILMLAVMVISTGGLALLNWKTALLLLVPLPVILGNFPVTRNLEYYYSYPFLPFLALSTVAGTAHLVKWVARRGETNILRFQQGLAVFVFILGVVQLPLKTRTNDHYRFPHSPTARDYKRLEVAADALPRDVPVAIQYGLWGVVPWRHGAVLLIDQELKDHHYVFMDERSPYGFGTEEFEKIASRLQSELASGQRHEIYNKYGFMIFSPATETGSPQGANGS